MKKLNLHSKIQQRIFAISCLFLIIVAISGCGGGGGTYGTGGDPITLKTISGIVLNQNGKPLSDVEVTINNQKVTKPTTIQGTFTAEIDAALVKDVLFKVFSDNLNADIRTDLPSAKAVQVRILVNETRNIISNVDTETIDSRNERDENLLSIDDCDLPNIPVCGQNGFSYNNHCEADNLNIPIAHQGDCESVRDGSCAQYYEPVCGSDGKTYANNCEADVANVDVVHKGECDKRNEDPCDSVESVPVCSDLGHTLTRCQAESAGVSIAYEGACKEIHLLI